MSDKVTLDTLRDRKDQGLPLALLTCYDYTTATLLAETGIDGIIVGDSLGQVMLGHETTLSVTMETMVTLTAAVRRGAPNLLLVGDMPYMSYESSEMAIANAGRLVSEAGCDVVKVELDYRQLDLVGDLSAAGIPVMAHLGYRPQSAQPGEKIVQTRQPERALEVIKDAGAMVEAGAAAVLLECVTVEAAGEVTRRVAAPVISCGSGPRCDGQVLVLQDVLGMLGKAGPRFAKVYGRIGEAIGKAAADYATEIHRGDFPDREHSYHMGQAEREQFERLLGELPETGGG